MVHDHEVWMHALSTTYHHTLKLCIDDGLVGEKDGPPDWSQYGTLAPVDVGGANVYYWPFSNVV